MLIILPSHLTVSGIVTWAARTVNQLRTDGYRAGLLVHAADGQVPAELENLIVARVTSGPPIDALDGRLEHLIPVYRAAVDAVRAPDGSPTLIAPSVPGDCYGVVAAIAQADPESIRVVSWLHSDNDYDIRVASHYEPMIHAFVPVSRELEQIASSSMPWRETDIHQLDHAVDVPECLPHREDLGERPLRLIYTGRIVEEQKRISALPAMSTALSERGIDYELKVVGEGPSLDELRVAFAGNERMQLVGRVPPTEVGALLRWADAWVSPSRYEGQCVAMLEAMGAGCVPIIPRVDSGVDGIIRHKETGLIADAGPDDTPQVTGIRLADSIEQLLRDGLGRMPQDAAQHIAEHHSDAIYTRSLRGIIERVRAMPPRAWPTDRPVAFQSQRSDQGGSTPSDAAERLRELLGSLSDRRVLIYGMGMHTLELASVLARCGSCIVGVLDDNLPPGIDRLWGWPVTRPENAQDLGASDVVISSFFHESSIWDRREILERQGLVVHRLYATQAV